MNSSQHSRGLSLLEMLVVLSLVSMVTTVLFQGYGFMLGNYQRIQVRHAEGLHQALAHFWFRDSLENLVARRAADKRFVGTATGISGESFAPLLSRAGVPIRIGWELRSTDQALELHYVERDDSLLVRSWPAGTGAAFRFRTDRGEWKDSWEVAEPRQLPSAVQLLLQGETDPPLQPVTAIVGTRKNQERRIQDIIDEQFR